MTKCLLRVQDLVVRFGATVALQGASFGVERGQICSLIGPNGAGKTTILDCTSGLCRPASGRISVGDVDIQAGNPHDRAKRGIGRTFQNVALFSSMTVRENVLVGAYAAGRTGVLGGALMLPAARREQAQAAAKARDLLALLDLEHVGDTLVAAQPYGRQKRVEIARALISDPILLLLDEPAAGLNGAEVDEVARLIVTLRRQFDLTILMVEHHMGLVMQISDKVIVLDLGKTIAEGDPATIRRDPQVVRAYLAPSRA